MDRLQPHQLIDLCLTMLAADGNVGASRAVATVQRMGAPEFQPTREVIESRLAQLSGAGCIAVGGEAIGAATVDALALTPVGKEYALSLVKSRDAASCTHLRLCFALKLGLADLLPANERRAVLDQVLAEHARAVDEADAAVGRCPSRAPALRAWWSQQAAQRRAEHAFIAELAD